MSGSLPSPIRIRLLREVAAGPISAVFAGEADTRLGPRRVAVKLLRDLPEGGVERLLDLRDRARPLALLGHRHHAAVIDVARVDERFALVAPYVDGIDLLDWMDVLGETGRVLPRRVTCEILRATAVAAEASLRGRVPGRSRAIGLVHRDLKPSNIMVARDGGVRITDFGTGFTALAGRAARAGALKKGLVRYLSPERREGHRSQDSADVYALGVLALELFRGKWLRRLRTKNPAHDRQLADVVARIEDLQMRSDADDRALRNLLLRMVAFDADARPDIAEVVASFRTWCDRAEGPSLEAFASAHAVPWLEEAAREPDERLAGAEAVIVERGQPLPPAGGGLPIITMPDRYDLQLEEPGETGEYGLDDGALEVTDPRLRRGPHSDPERPVLGDLDADVEVVLSPPEARALPAEPLPPAPSPQSRRPSVPSPTAAGLLELDDDVQAPMMQASPAPRIRDAELQAVFVDEDLLTPSPAPVRKAPVVAVEIEVEAPPPSPALMDEVELELDLEDDVPTDEAAPLATETTDPLRAHASPLRWVLLASVVVIVTVALGVGAVAVAVLLSLQ